MKRLSGGNLRAAGYDDRRRTPVVELVGNVQIGGVVRHHRRFISHRRLERYDNIEDGDYLANGFADRGKSQRADARRWQVEAAMVTTQRGRQLSARHARVGCRTAGPFSPPPTPALARPLLIVSLCPEAGFFKRQLSTPISLRHAAVGGGA
jgi:hypothetical protein